MPGAGFYAVESGKISFRSDGYWYSDDERIENPRIALLFSKHLQRASDGSYYLQIREERAPVIVEDTPYVVVTVEGTPETGITLVLNDETREPLHPQSLAVGPDNVLYCRVKGGEFPARFLRSAYYHLANAFETDETGRELRIRLGSKSYEIRRLASRPAR